MKRVLTAIVLLAASLACAQTGSMPCTGTITISGTCPACSYSSTCSTAVTQPPPPSGLQIGAIPDTGTVGVLYKAPLSASGGPSPYAWTVTGLPPGIKLTTSTIGVLGGSSLTHRQCATMPPAGIVR